MSEKTDLLVESGPDLEDLALDEDYALTAAFVDMVIDAADRSDGARLAELVAALRPADVADLMGFLTADYRGQIVPHIPPDALAEILS
jgi:magnesium transporter